ncbi:cation transporter [Mannheimia massilioguelmaensis]|uniref:cation transporter n=1 Tax=Mannheimia massilioguelmaensis TaxID=1604354 RepID=UPI0005CA4127|nr:cation transporter [Mannheimia massilioguelmaensis]
MANIILALGDLSCGHCIKSVTKAIEAISGPETAEVTLNFAKINSDKDPQEFIHAIVDAGFQAKVATPSFELDLAGLNCGHCIKSVTKALNSVENVEAVNVELTHAKVYGSADPEAAIKAVVDADFQASLARK